MTAEESMSMMAEDSPKVSISGSPVPDETGDHVEDIDKEDDTEENLDEEFEEYVQEDYLCSICDEKFKEPRVLSCLHVFCTNCLKNQVEPKTPDDDASDANSEIICNTCQQETRLGPKVC
jgi:hypothetical protein